MLLNKLLHRENGDTIVEVLISLAILTLVLGGAYYTASQSYSNDRDSQEHSQALTLAQTQLEELQVFIDTGNSLPAGAQCLQVVNNAVTNTNTIQPDGSATENCLINGNYTSDIYTNSTNTCPSAAAYCYTVAITNVTQASPIYLNVGQPTTSKVQVSTYEVSVSWLALGKGTDYVELYDRVDGQS